ncbi:MULTISPECIES: helix-turn-helix transcriptional regulator [unclassified Actinopolyspora]|uniref:helix-turn-helix domain-containing protein n=1 Tax=unclassified Actinopolyspora TaxID=2639451 RepID=UPI0013F60A3A|nr:MULTISPECIES: helix-turn-helix transcriptional regulator [unclassified Actinopolyspora]NHD17674.1 helix-turn-helix domain-containing protein [Actinopolyspora sp. BKK2]NHE76593.1 helix-turn-helix domain-containing protein [Actinopolyspora sp. BKK1]
MAGTARQVHLGRQLKSLRNDKGLSLDDVARHVERSRATVGHWERGYSRISAQDLAALLRLYEAPDEMSGHLQQLRRDSRQRGWWHSYKLPAYLEPFVGFEAEASEVFSYELGVVPGLLQTEDYARAIHEVGRLQLSEAELQGWVDVRLKRQERLYERPGGLTLHTVIAEEALRRVVGSRKIMVEQLARLEHDAKLPGVNLQVLPLDAGAHVGAHGPITVLRFADAGHSDVAFSDTPLGGHVIDDLRDVAELSRLFGELQAQALQREESGRLLRSIAEVHAAGPKE